MVLSPRQKELSWIDKHIQENGNKGQEPKEDKPLSKRANYKRTENQTSTHLKTGLPIITTKKIKI